ncbi:hypothetical protein C9374_012087 [Naegleria lovaniensis]|uniref:Alcohol dehydrogenase-like C-terminal domain-containing protein n=1 Tax=Naegleria lovaniensis TaxID=51637 RepID=A0AA88GDL4_NAELO|nr:uncharacterized protein C9374_012087 [Naegleria lovaniensis]KAG2373480.1 hypothetical protein C9374_012087 [Naegleria lovaniensis]
MSNPASLSTNTTTNPSHPEEETSLEGKSIVNSPPQPTSSEDPLLPPPINTQIHKGMHDPSHETASPTSASTYQESQIPSTQPSSTLTEHINLRQQQQQDPHLEQASMDDRNLMPPPSTSPSMHSQQSPQHHDNTSKYISTQIHLKSKPKSKDDLLENIITRQVTLPPLEEGDIIIKILYIAMDASFRTLVCQESDRYCPPPFCGPSKSMHPPPPPLPHQPCHQQYQQQPQHQQTALPSSTTLMEHVHEKHSKEENKKCQLHHGVLKGYAVGEVIESRNRLFTKGRNVYGNLGIQKYLYSSGGKDLDDNLVRDITMNSSLASFLTLSKAGLCAYFAVTEISQISEGDTVMVTGGSGCVGALIPQIVRAYLTDQHVKKQRQQELLTNLEKPSSLLVNNKSNTKSEASLGTSTTIPSTTRTHSEGLQVDTSQPFPRMCSKAKSPTLNWCVHALVGSDQSPRGGGAMSRSFYQSPFTEEKEDYNEMRHRLFHHPSSPALFSSLPPPSMMITKPSSSMVTSGSAANTTTATTTQPSYVPQVQILGLCSSEKKVRVMKQNFKYDECLDYSQHLKKPVPFDVTPSGTFCAGGSCFEPTFESTQSSSVNVPPSPSSALYLTDVYKRISEQIDRESLSEAIRTQCPNGIDVLIDTVGGFMLDVCLEHINHNARVVLCGAISQHNASKIEGPFNYVNLILKSARMEGFVLDKFKSKFKEASQTLVRWIQEKKLNGLEEHVVECNLGQKEDVARVFSLLYAEDYTGKLILRVRH